MVSAPAAPAAPAADQRRPPRLLRPARQGLPACPPARQGLPACPGQHAPELRCLTATSPLRGYPRGGRAVDFKDRCLANDLTRHRAARRTRHRPRDGPGRDHRRRHLRLAVSPRSATRSRPLRSTWTSRARSSLPGSSTCTVTPPTFPGCDCGHSTASPRRSSSKPASAPSTPAYRQAAAEGRPVNYGFAASWALARMEAVAGIELDGRLGTFLANIATPAWQGPASRPR